MLKSLSSTLVSAFFVLAALAIGAGFGSLTSPDAPAHAETPTVTATQTSTGGCEGMLCASQGHARLSGGGGNLHGHR